ncbi:MAG: DNA primase [Methylococcales bacterium]|nr:DNA primase [Methylococcales bacterium]
MSGSRIPHDFIDDLLVRVDIVDLIDSHVPLKKAGSSYVARCPFHTEKSPSFSVNRKKQFYHCFGCGVGGNAISFLMEFSHLGFVEAIEDLAGFVGIDVPRESSGYAQQKQDYSALYSILEQVAVFYVDQLRNHPQGKDAIQYLKNRGLSGEVAKEFSLGYAPNEWDSLALRFDNELLLKSGMLTGQENGKVFDRFRGRLVFPIRDKRKRIVGFGGRVLDGSLPKYLNSPETPIFSKGMELYGLFELLEKRSKPKRIILVEGYMDVLALSQFGVFYSVAALGTAASKGHMDLLFRFTTEIVFCFDGDAAGKKAAWRAVQEILPCLRDGRQSRVMLVPDGQDPDSLIRNKGRAAFEQQVQNSSALSDYFFEHVSKDLDLTTIEGRSRLVAEAKPYIEKIPAGVFRDMMGGKLEELSGRYAKKVLEPVEIEKNRLPSLGKRGDVKSNKLSPARTAIALLLQNPDLIDVFEEKEFDLKKVVFPGLSLLTEVVQVIERAKSRNSAVLLEYFRGKSSEKIIKSLINQSFIIDDGMEAEFSGALDRLIEQANEAALSRLLNKENTEGLAEDEKAELRKLFAFMNIQK